MSAFWLYILTAFAFVFVIEGLLYALFPGAVRRMFAMALSWPEAVLRRFGTVMALSGFLIVWLLHSLAGG